MEPTRESEWIETRRTSVTARCVLADVCYLSSMSREGSVRADGLLARLIGISEDELSASLAELTACGVLAVENGIVTSPRLLRERRLRQISVENGKKGGRPRKLSLFGSEAPAET
jgi:hypothetical protein